MTTRHDPTPTPPHDAVESVELIDGGELTTEGWIHRHQDYVMYVYALDVEPCPLICRYAGYDNACDNDEDYRVCIMKNTIAGNLRSVEFDYDSGVRVELP